MSRPDAFAKYRRPRLVPAKCKACDGAGAIPVDTSVLLSRQAKCPACHGKGTVGTEVR